MRELPISVQRRLYRPEDASAGIADPGRAFNPSDAIDDPSIPSSRLVTGLRAGNRWVVAVERGGFAYGTEVLLFNTAEAEAERITWLRTPPANYHDLLVLVPSLKKAG